MNQTKIDNHTHAPGLFVTAATYRRPLVNGSFTRVSKSLWFVWLTLFYMTLCDLTPRNHAHSKSLPLLSKNTTRKKKKEVNNQHNPAGKAMRTGQQPGGKSSDVDSLFFSARAKTFCKTIKIMSFYGHVARAWPYAHSFDSGFGSRFYSLTRRPKLVTIKISLLSLIRSPRRL